MPTVALDGVTAIAAVLIASFCIDRFVAGILFLLSFNHKWSQFLPDPVFLHDDVSRFRAGRKRQLVRTILAALLAIPLVVIFGQMRILAAVGFETINRYLDQALTAVILIGGAGQLDEIFKWGAEHRRAPESAAASKPVEVTGKLVLEQGESTSLAKGAN